jgi:DNA-binding transcriptional LysR family regulator
MDTAQAQTFLAIVEGGSFAAAARRLNVTQSTVSMRIKALEENLGRSLFVRNRAGASLTPAGQQFQRYATGVMALWSQAQLDVALPAGLSAGLTLGAQYSLWDGLLDAWLSDFSAAFPDVALRGEVGQADQLMARLAAGELDLVALYAPEARSGVVIAPWFVDEMVLVASSRRSKAPYSDDYLYVDWGPDFQAAHAATYPDCATPRLFLQLGAIALPHLLRGGGAGYFPRRLVRQALGERRLFEVNRPVFHRQAYLAYPEALAGEGWFQAVLESLKAKRG